MCVRVCVCVCVCVEYICSRLTESGTAHVSHQRKAASISRGLRAGRLTSAAKSKSKEDVRGLGEEGVCVCVCVCVCVLNIFALV